MKERIISLKNNHIVVIYMDKNKQNSLQHSFKSIGANKWSLYVVLFLAAVWLIYYSFVNRDDVELVKAVVMSIGFLIIIVFTVMRKWNKND